MSKGHTQRKRFTDKEIYQKLSYGSDVPSKAYHLPSPIAKRLEFTYPPPPSPLLGEGRHLWMALQVKSYNEGDGLQKYTQSTFNFFSRISQTLGNVFVENISSHAIFPTSEAFMFYFCCHVVATFEIT